jgi:methyltransferase (TIGR00027 family)
VQEQQASPSALRVAVQRAAHQLLEVPPVFADPFALRIIGAKAEAALRADLAGFQIPTRRALRAWGAVRSRFAEDELAEAVQRGMRQYVLLGAGLDTFACRNPHAAAGLRVFEVDQPASQAWKRERLAAGGIAAKPGSAFAPADFERQELAQGLAAAGFTMDRPAFFSWLGVTTYLTREATLKTLGFVAARPAGSAIVFTYNTPPDRLDAAERAEFDARAAQIAAIGEPWRGFWEPDELAAALRGLKFSHVEDLGPDEIYARYLAGRNDGFRSGPSGHLLLATV